MTQLIGDCARSQRSLARCRSLLRVALLLMVLMAAVAPADARNSQARPPGGGSGAGSTRATARTSSRRLQQAQQRCPPPSAPVSAPGCPCTVPSVQQQQQQKQGGGTAAARNVCPAGFRCSPSAAAYLVSAGWRRQDPSARIGPPPDFAASSDASDSNSTTAGVCVPCQIGEYCALGTQEETWLSLSTCRHVAPPGSAGAPADKQGNADPLASCRGFKPCPAGRFCPNASVAQPCEPGRWCPSGSTASQSCNITNLLAWNPFKLVQPSPQSMLEALASSGLPLTGNACPANASTPLQSCEAGEYCPSPQQRLTCPAGYFCPRNSQAPKRCPALASCSSPGIATPTWSWLGLLLMLLLLALLLILLEFARMAGHKRSKASTSEDEVAQLISAVGYQMVSTQERCVVRRVAQLQQRPRLSRFKTRLNRAFARHLPVAADGSLGRPGPLAGPLAEAHEERLGRASSASDDVRGGFYDQGAIGHLDGSEELSAPLPGVLDAAAAPAAAASGASMAGAATGRYRISPRVTLVFSSVWVADRSLLRARRLAEARRLMQHGGAPAVKPGRADTNNEAVGSSDAIASAAASHGARFIVPGVSGSFASAQLHAVMGPSGCGKTTMCKALAGRLPLSRVCGDIVFVCEADGAAPTAVPVMLSPADAKPMIGFVPQFDLLHESLSVHENLMLAARLRLPITQDARRSKWQRSHDVRAVVEEVVALMALDSIVHQVIGASTSRSLSGGQRKRVAIGVELVAKPCLLLLDEPTSGLDAAVAADVVAALKASALAGMNILAVMHQPRVSIFSMFDTTTLLGSGGYIVYAGPTALTLPYLSFLGFQPPAGENTADFLLDVIAGVVPRPGDPDFMPRQLAALWDAAGAAWIRHAQRHPGAALAPPAPAAGPPDWPWRPRDLEALLGRFNLQAGQQEVLAARRARRAGGGRHLHLRHDNKAPVLASQPTVAPSLPSRSQLMDGGDHRNEGGAGSSSSGGRSVLSYDGFCAFWEEAGLRKWLSKGDYAAFMEAVCDDFGMSPGSSISQTQFLDVLKAHLRRAAAAAASEQGRSSQVAAVQLPLVVPLAVQAAETGARTSLDGAASAASSSSQHAPVASEETPDASGRQLCRINTLAANSVFASFGAQPASEASSELLPELSDQALPQLPLPQGTVVAAGLASSQLAPIMSVAAPGILATPTVRLQQHAGWRRQQTLARAAGKQSSVTGSIGSEAAAVQQQQQHQQPAPPPGPTTPAYARRSIELAPAGLGRPLHSVPLGLPGGGNTPQRRGLRASSSTLGPRARQDGQLGGLARPLQSVPAGLLCVPQQLQPTHTLADVAQLIQLQQLQDEGEGVQAGASPPQRTTARSKDAHAPLALLPDDDVEAARTPAPPPAPTAAEATPHGVNAAAVLAGRRLPSRGAQLWLVVVRAGRKWVSSRGALMTDLLLSALLGLALGAAQGHISSPPESVLWLLITLLAYGCMTLARSIQRYGEERHIYLQQESQAGLSVVAWVFGHQLFDVINLVLQPALFFSWLYVMTLPPMSALTYFLVLLAVGWYTSGLGYLVSLLFAPRVTLLAGLAVALLLGGVANGVAPRLWQLSGTHPLAWLDQLSYTRWGLQAMYIDWLVSPAAAEAAPATAAFLGSMGWCGLQPTLLVALQSSGSSPAQQRNGTTDAALGRHEWWNMTGVERADAMASEAAAVHGSSGSGDAAAAAALTQLWQYAVRPELLQQQCAKQEAVAFAVLLGLGAACRLLLLLLVKFKVFRKAQE